MTENTNSLTANKPILLHIEDDLDSRALVRRILRSDFHILEAEDADKGYDMALENRPDFIIMDINLPFMSGHRLATSLRNDLGASIPIVALTGADISQRNEILVAGCTGFIQKPITDSREFRQAMLSYFAGKNDKVDALTQVTAQASFVNNLVRDLRTALERERLLNTQLIRDGLGKSKFITITNHELRTPLSLIVGYLDILDHLPPDDPEYPAVLSGIKRSTKAMVALVERLNLITQLLGDTHHDIVHKSQQNQLFYVLDLWDHVKSYTENAIRDERCGKLKLTTSDPENTRFSMMRGDVTVARYAFEELISNAIKFTPDGGTIKLSGRINDNNVEIFICDDGIGMPQDQVPYLMELFTSEANNPFIHSTGKFKFRGGGLGIGLALTSYIINSLGGKLTIMSNKQTGTQVLVSFPLEKMNE